MDKSNFEKPNTNQFEFITITIESFFMQLKCGSGCKDPIVLRSLKFLFFQNKIMHLEYAAPIRIKRATLFLRQARNTLTTVTRLNLIGQK